MKTKKFLIIFTFLTTLPIIAQIDSTNVAPSEPKLSVLDSIRKTFVTHDEISKIDNLWMKELSNTELSTIQFSDILNFNPDKDVDYDLPTSVLKERLAKLDAKSPFNIEYNVGLENVIKGLLKNRKKSYERLLAISQYYFPLFEDALAKYNIPIEVKYLAIVESALNPKATSRVGAKGLWQFMYGTGIQYNLPVNSYIDTRCDPLKATEAACKYLSGMYKIFGDWDLVLASYNCGPGNVTKAIRRSGGQKNYWNIRKNLPQETAGYLPAFLATMYIFEYHKEHGINETKAPVNYFTTDTLMVKRQLSFDQISKLIDISTDELAFLNPSYKLGVIPYDNVRNNYIRLPIDKASVFASNEDKIYYYANYEDNLREKPNNLYTKRNGINIDNREYVTRYKFHKVNKGESLSAIASKYGVTSNNIIKWNRLRRGKLPYGRNIKIIVTEKILANDIATNEPKTEEKTTENEVENEVKNIDKPTYKEEKVVSYKKITKTHKVKKGDTLGEIADKYNVLVADLKQWNHLKKNNVSKGKVLKIISEERVVTTIRKKIKTTEVTEPKNEIVNNTSEESTGKNPIVTVDISKEKPAYKEEKVVSYKKATKTHKVKKGDTLGEIADKYNVSVADLKQWNHLKKNNVSKGKVLKIIYEERVVTTVRKKIKTTEQAELKNEVVNNTSEVITDKKTVVTENTPKEKPIYVEEKVVSLKKITKTHKAKSGDTLGEIAEKYNVSVADLKQWNKIKKNTVAKGKVLKIISEERVVTTVRKKVKSEANNLVDIINKNADSTSKKNNEYTVEKGDVLFAIAKKNNVTTSQLKAWNNLTSDDLTLGQKLIVQHPVTNEIGNNITEHILTRDDNIWNVSKKYGVTADQLKEWNHLTDNKLKKGTKLIVLKPKDTNVKEIRNEQITKESTKEEKLYLVKRGDSLFSISQKLKGVTVADLKKWNNISSNGLKPGMKIKISG